MAEMRVPMSYRLPNPVVISLGTLAPAIGILEAMAACLQRPASAELPVDVFTAVQTQFETRARIGVLVRAFWKEVEDAVAALSRPGQLGTEQQFESKLRCAMMMKMAASLGAEVFAEAGTKAAYLANPLSRMVADLQVLSTHYLTRVEPVSATLAMMSRRR